MDSVRISSPRSPIRSGAAGAEEGSWDRLSLQFWIASTTTAGEVHPAAADAVLLRRSPAAGNTLSPARVHQGHPDRRGPAPVCPPRLDGAGLIAVGQTLPFLLHFSCGNRPRMPVPALLARRGRSALPMNPDAPVMPMTMPLIQDSGRERHKPKTDSHRHGHHNLGLNLPLCLICHFSFALFCDTATSTFSR